MSTVKHLSELILEKNSGLIIIANKWDLVEKDSKTSMNIQRVLDQRLALVLGHGVDLAGPRINTIREHEIDDAEFAAKGRGRLAARESQVAQAFAAPAGHDDGQGTAGEPADIAAGRRARGVSGHATDLL